MYKDVSDRCVIDVDSSTFAIWDMPGIFYGKYLQIYS